MGWHIENYKQFLEEFVAEYGDVIYFTEVCWLSMAQV